MHLPESLTEHHTSRWSKDPRWIQVLEDSSCSASALCSAQPMPQAGICPTIQFLLPSCPPLAESMMEKPWAWQHLFHFFPNPEEQRFNCGLVILLKEAGKHMHYIKLYVNWEKMYYVVQRHFLRISIKKTPWQIAAIHLSVYRATTNMWLRLRVCIPQFQ